MHDADDKLVLLAKTDPVAAVARAAPHLDHREADVAARARWATGRALFELADNDEAIASLRSAAAIALDTSLRQRIEVSLAAALGAAGRPGEARTLLDAIEHHAADEHVLALASSQSALIDLGAGDVISARRRLIDAVPTLLATASMGDSAAAALGNLGYCEMVVGDLEQAAKQFDHAIRLADERGESLVAIGCQQNLGYVAMLRGNYPQALAALDEAQRAYEDIDAPSRNFSTLFHDLAEVRRLAGLGPESVEAAMRAVEIVVDGGNEERIAEARYQLALCCLDDGRIAEAREMAALADAEFRSASRTLWSHRCALIELESVIADPEPDPATLQRASDSVGDLVELGWTSLAVRIANGVAFAAWKAGDAAPERHLTTTPPPDGQLPILDSLELRFREVLLASSGGEDPMPALLGARTLVADHGNRLRDPELRARSTRLGHRFRQLGLGAALAQGSPEMALRVEEMWRAGAGPERLVSPVDPDVASAAEALRRFVAEHPDHSVRAEEAAEIRRLENELRRTSFRSSGGERGGADIADFDVSTLRDRLGDRCLVELLDVRDELWAVEVDHSTSGLRRVGTTAEVLADADQLRQGLARLLRPGLSAARAETRWERLLDESRRFAERLGLRAGFGDIVIAPTAALRAVPWSLVTIDVGAVTIAPDATRWTNAVDRVDVGEVGVLVGPRLEHAGSDADELVRRFPDATVATGATATGAALGELAGRTDLLHIAAHGAFRSDTPWFSSLELVDGPFTLYDLEDVAAPELVTLAACDTGRTAVDGAELTGVAPAWIHAGSRRVLAPVCAVPDLAASAFAARYYGTLLGVRPEHALRRTLEASLDSEVIERATAAAFVTYGSDIGCVSNARVTASE